MIGVWHHLVSLGLLKDLLGVGVNVTGGAAAAYLPWKRHRQAQTLIADRLDTTTPGGLGDLTPRKAARR